MNLKREKHFNNNTAVLLANFLISEKMDTPFGDKVTKFMSINGFSLFVTKQTIVLLYLCTMEATVLPIVNTYPRGKSLLNHVQSGSVIHGNASFYHLPKGFTRKDFYP